MHQYGAHAALATIIARVLRRPLVLKLTNSGSEGVAKVASQGRVLARIVRGTHRRADAVVALTEHQRREAIAFGIPAERVYVIGNGLDTTLFTPATASQRADLKSRLGVESPHMAVFVGRLAPAKDLPMLLRAWQIAQTQGLSGWELVVVGDGALREDLLREALSLGISDSVRFVGQQAHVVDWLRASEVFVLTSLHEGMSNSLLEAMACGLPVVATAVSGVEELVRAGACGEVVPVGDAREFARALVRLASSPEQRGRMGEKARRQVADAYSIDAIARRHAEIYAALGSRNGKARAERRARCP